MLCCCVSQACLMCYSTQIYSMYQGACNLGITQQRLAFRSDSSCFSSTGVPNLGYICLSEGVHLRISIDKQNIFAYILFQKFTHVSDYSFKKPLYAYCWIYLWIIMIKCIVIGNFRGTCASVKMLKGYILTCWNAEGYMLIFRNAEGVHGKRKFGNPWYSTW